MKNIDDLREELFDTIQLLKSGKISVEQANAIGGIGQVIVNTAKAEVAFIKETASDGTGFIDSSKVKKLDRPKSEYSNSGHESTMKKYASQ